jgi:uncharacterized membrane protein YedE/YeeE
MISMEDAMAMAEWLETYGNPAVLATGGALIGGLFGLFAQRSRFCLRAAVIEFWHHRFGDKLTVWLLAFSAAVISVQVMALMGWLDTSNARQISATGSISGALTGGLFFGIGMIMTRGCASRLLVLSATGNLRALLSGLIFAVTAQSALSGVLSPLRLSISSWWTVDGGASRDLLALAGFGHGAGLALGLLCLHAALYFSLQSPRRGLWMWIGGIGTGLMVGAAWGFSQWVSRESFDPVQIQGLTFSGPSAEWLMRLVQWPPPPMGFDFGLLPGVFIGSLLGALMGKEWKLEGFTDGYSMRRYMGGAVLMGFGAMLAGGCAVGAGVTGGAIFALTAWISLAGMWLGAGLTDRWLDGAIPVAAQPRQT